MRKEYKHLPKQLVDKLTSIEGRVLFLQTTATIFAAICGLIFSFLVLYLSERLWATPQIIRLFIILGGTGATIFYALRWVKSRINFSKDPAATSKLLQKHFSFLGDSLQSIIELADDENKPTNISPELCDAAIKQVANKASKLDFNEAVSNSKTRNAGLIFIGGIIIIALFFVFDSNSIMNSFKRWKNPFSNEKRYTFVQLQELEPVMHVAYGEPFELELKFHKNSRLRPTKATISFNGNSNDSVTLNNIGGTYENKKGKMADTVMDIKVGDLRKSVDIKPVHRPVLLNLQAKIQLPDYLKSEPINRQVNSKTLTILKGSSLILSAKASNPLTQASILNLPNNKINHHKRDFTTGKIDTLKTKKITISWRDVYNHKPLEDYELTFIEKEDMLPTSSCPKLPTYTTMLEGEALTIKAAASDDYGVQDIYMEWKIYDENNQPFAGGTPFQKLVIKTIENNAKELTGEFEFVPEYLKIPAGSKVIIFASSTDRCPDHKPVASRKHQINIISLSTHARLVQEELEKLQRRIEEIGMREEQSLETNKAIASLDKKDLESATSAQRLAEQEQAEKNSADKVENITKDGANLLKEALRNKDFPRESIKEWNKMLDQLSKIGSQQMSKVSQSLGKASSQPQAKERKEATEEAIKEQQKIVDSLAKMSQKMDDSKQNMAMRNFAARLEKASKTENAVAFLATNLIGETIGLSEDQLTDKIRDALINTADKQLKINIEIKSLKNEVYKFFERSKLEDYKILFEAMTTSKVNDNLIDVKKDIDDNHLAKVIPNAKKWSKTFMEWSKLLKKKSGGGGKGGGKKKEKSEEELEVLLKLLEFLQEEQEIYEKTSFLEHNKKDNKEYKTHCKKLADQQFDMARTCLEMMTRIEDQKLQKLLQVINGCMGDAADYLDKPNTGTDALSAQSAVIEIIATVFGANKDQDQKDQKQQQQQQTMQQMMQQMMAGKKPGKKPGQKPGGNKSGNPFDGKNSNISGTAGKGLNDIDKKADGSTGFTRENLPDEFREALESYFKGREGK